MKKLIYVTINLTFLSLFLILACSNMADKDFSYLNEKEFDLNWKLGENDSLVYKTVMNPIGEASFETNFGGLFDEITDSTQTDFKEIGKDFFSRIKEQYNYTNLITKLTNSKDFQDVINVEMISEAKDKEEDEKSDRMSNMMIGTILRGSINKNGSLHSFWMTKKQKNLLSMFFELPDRKVRKGDSWVLNNVDLIDNDHNFICREAKKKNCVSLTDIREEGGRTIAVIDYDIYEFVSGEFKSPVFFKGEKSIIPTKMEFIFRAQAEFSIDEGKWISYTGIMSLDASGVINSVQKQKFALIEQ